jgi:phenylacetic acid degradation operon negative regulatory protein
MDEDFPNCAVSENENIVFSLFGALFDGKHEGISLKCFYAMLGTFGYSEEAVRLLLSRMAKKGLLAARRKGKASYYFLSERGEAITKRGGDRSVRRGEPGLWDGRFRLISYEFPESAKEARLGLAAALRLAGFGRVSPGTWVLPCEFPQEVETSLADAALYGTIERFDAVHRGDEREFARRIWKLDERRIELDSYVRRFASEAAKRKARKTAPRDSEDFAAYFRSLFAFVPAMSNVPPLPDAMLPIDWPAREAKAIFLEHRALVHGGAERFFKTAHEPY